MISEIFGPVIQGEGPIIGQRTVFVRTFGCDSRCEMCDTMYSVDPKAKGANTRSTMSAEEIVGRVTELCGELFIPVTISGGNPAMWDLELLIRRLSEENLPVWVETQGTIWRDWLRACRRVTVSPKGPGMNDTKCGILEPGDLVDFVNRLQSWGDQLTFKVVIFGPADLDYAEWIHKSFPEIPLYLSVGALPLPRPDGTERYLARRLRYVMQEALDRPALYDAIVLPQLHAIAFGGRRGV